jgi:two-component system, LytTR family, sensor histidine kinase AlgZ
VVAAGALFASPKPTDWFYWMPVLCAVAVPGLFTWLLACCALKNSLARLSRRLQWAVGVALGAVCAALGYAFMQWVGLMPDAYLAASAAAGACVAALLVAGLMLRAKAQLPAATTARLTELQARIRPHFLFNAINSAIALVRDDPARAEQVLEDLSELFRHALAESSADVSLADEVELARSYLSIEQVRFGARMVVEWDIDPRANTARVPAMILQPLVENAVKHGVEPNSKGGTIKVSTALRGASVVVRVSNTVSPVATSTPGNGIALNNVRERLSLLHDVRASFVAQRQGDVFQARMELPLGHST